MQPVMACLRQILTEGALTENTENTEIKPALIAVRFVIQVCIYLCDPCDL